MSDKTLCMIARQGENDEYKHYDVHNLFGWSQTEPTLRSLREVLNKRSIVITRSTFVSSGAYAGHWLGDNISKWTHLKYNIIGMLESNLFGIPYVSCGSFHLVVLGSSLTAETNVKLQLVRYGSVRVQYGCVHTHSLGTVT